MFTTAGQVSRVAVGSEEQRDKGTFAVAAIEFSPTSRVIWVEKVPSAATGTSTPRASSLLNSRCGDWAPMHGAISFTP